MSAVILPFNPGAALARISTTPIGYQIECRGPHGVRHYDFSSVAEAGEFAVTLRDEGRWRLRFSTGAEAVQAIVDEIDGEAA